MDICRICERPAIPRWLDFGPKAIRNRFLRAPQEETYAHPLAVGACRLCGMVQLADPPPVEELLPRVDWIRYNEPEQHLDELAARLTQLPGVSPHCVFAGLSYKDDSTLERLNRLGYAATWRPDCRDDLGIRSVHAGIESIQEKLRPRLAAALARKFARPDVLVVRHVLEHTHQTRAALDWARTLVKPNGYVVFEVPDVTRALEQLDHTTIWEEHVLYFTPATLRGCLERFGFEVVSLKSHPYTLENSLVVIARPTGEIRVGPPVRDPAAERFIREFPRCRTRIHDRLGGHARIAMLGAGHMTSAFVDLYELADRIECVVDDNPLKQGHFMPGSRLPIVPSSDLVDRRIDLCLMTVRPEIEAAVAGRNSAFVERGGVLASVFPGSPYSLSRVDTPIGALP
jgi:hypothetical protein